MNAFTRPLVKSTSQELADLTLIPGQEDFPAGDWLVSKVLTEIVALVEAAEKVDSWPMMRLLREGEPLNSDTQEARFDASALNVALACLRRALEIEPAGEIASGL